MASSKRLGQLLLEQQEPFVLDIYLLERGYSETLSNRKKKRNEVNNISSCSKLAKAVFNKLLLVSTNSPSNITLNKTQKTSKEFAMVVEERMSSASSFNSFPDSETSSPQQKHQISKQVGSDRKFEGECMEEDIKQQLSPISVLEDTFSDQYATVYNDNAEKQRVKKTRKTDRSTVCNTNNTTIKKKNETIFSVTLSKLLEHASTEKPINHNFSADFMKIKLALQETKQLLSDCVGEIIESYRSKKGKQQQHSKEILGAEEIGKILHDNVTEWSRQTIHGTNITRLLKSDLMATYEEWDNNLRLQRKEIAKVIEDFISEDLIFEIVADMVLNPQSSPTKVRMNTED